MFQYLFVHLIFQLCQEGCHLQVGYTSIIMPCVQHNEVEERSNREGSPDTQIVVHIYLPNGHPLEVGPHSVHLPLFKGDILATVLDVVLHEAGLCIVPARHAVAVSVIADLMVIPNWDPCEVLEVCNGVKISAI